MLFRSAQTVAQIVSEEIGRHRERVYPPLTTLGLFIEQALSADQEKGSSLALTHFIVYNTPMSRPLRLELAGGLYHVTSRGDRREDIYVGDADRLVWLEILAQVCKRFNWRVHAWCQMSNHYHLVVETVEGNLSLGMRQLNGVYTQTINRTHSRVGHVFKNQRGQAHKESKGSGSYYVVTNCFY